MEVTVEVPEGEPETAPVVVVPTGSQDNANDLLIALLEEKLNGFRQEIAQQIADLQGSVGRAEIAAEIAAEAASEVAETVAEPEPVSVVEETPDPAPEPDEEPERGHWFHEPIHFSGN
jgi:hypothetical protein